MTWDTWFENGLKFECTGCGACCKTHGEYAYVYLSDTDVGAISEFLGLSRIAFLNAYCTTDEDGDIFLADMVGDCAFLEKGNRCKIYPVRPKQCATWPFWTENMEQEIWEGPITDCCEGVGKGKLHTKVEIKKICRERDRWYKDL